jgi:hypothetical protein
MSNSPRYNYKMLINKKNLNIVKKKKGQPESHYAKSLNYRWAKLKDMFSSQNILGVGLS